MSKLLMSPRWLEEKKQHTVFCDFDHYTTAEDFTTVSTDSGTVAVSDGANGVVAIAASDGTVADNDQTYLKGTTETFLFANDKPIVFEASVQFTEANTDDANVGVGLANGVAAELLVDDGAGVKTSGDILAIYKVDGGTVWKCISSKGSSQTISTSTSTAGGSSYQTLTIEWKPTGSSSSEAHFYLDGSPLIDSTTLKPIVHRFDYSSSPTEMQVFAGVKNGGSNLETLNVDYLGCTQRR